MKKEGRSLDGGRGQQSGCGDGTIYGNEGDAQKPEEKGEKPKNRLWVLEIFGAVREKGTLNRRKGL